ncbi:MAG: SGNH/GDSL hydrolase family protein [Erysipelotrichaceae bacterium]|nr:SGNH/GDSL hydrolase family protein [Erysipelotrichaceae bacterium]
MKKYWLIPLTAAAVGAALGFYKVKKKHPGDAEMYAPELAEKKESILAGKKIMFLGSSVTYGRDDVSFVEYLQNQYGVIVAKEALSGTTLVNKKIFGRRPYVDRIKDMDKDFEADLFICQLSTNDATTKQPLGEVSEGYALEDFDTSTIAGAIEYIIAYAKNTWNCPIMFYTNGKYESEHYQKMTELLAKIKEKWDIGIIDLWNELNVSSLSKQQYQLYMIDKIHPSLCGYRDFWTPFIARKLEAFFENR